MNKKISLTFVWLILMTVILSGCGVSETDLVATVESRVSVAVVETQTALPTATLVHTATPYPTYTPLASQTPYPTLIPYPTHTPLPTYTVPPTETAVPTATATETGTPTAVPPTATPVSSGSSAPVGATAIGSSPQQQLKEAINATLSAMDNFRYELQSKCQNPTDTGFCWQNKYYTSADCAQVINAHQRLINSRPATFSTTSTELTDIYNAFVAHTNQLIEITSPYQIACQEVVSSGGTHKDFGGENGGAAIALMNPVLDQLHQLLSLLEE